MMYVEHCNRAAIRAFLDGDIDTSLEMLKSATQMLRSIQEANDSSVRDVEQIMGLDDDGISPMPVQSFALGTKWQHALHDISNSVFPFFDQFLLVSLPNRHNETIKRATAVLLFNVGLCHHLKGIRAAENSAEYQLALRFYGMASSLLFYAAADNSLEYAVSGHCGLLALALANNMGHIHEAFMNFEKASVCLDWLRSFFGAMPDSESAAQEDTMLGFYVTAFLFPKWIFNPAAAA